MNRREFLGCLAAAGAAVSLGKSAAAAERMFVSLNGALTSGKNVAWPELARLAARTGYGGVDWSLEAAEREGLERTQALFSELRIVPTIANLPMARPLPFAGDEPAFRAVLPPLSDHAAFCAAAGCHEMMVVLPPTGPLPKNEFRKAVRDRVAAVGEVLNKHAIRLGLEFLGVEQFRAPREGVVSHPFIWTLPETAALAAECGSNVGVILDAWHWHHSGGTTAEIARTDRSRIIHVHVSDAKPMAPADVRDNMRVMPGEGVIDLTGFFRALQSIGYTGGVSPEPPGRITADMTAEQAARLGLETTVAVMRKAGILNLQPGK